jgi:hypothetical protein
MSSARNGQQVGGRDRNHVPIRRLRYDDLASIVARCQPPGSALATATPGLLARSHSGRRFVVVAVLSVLMIWGVFALVFREWRIRYRDRAIYGVTEVVPAIDPLAAIVPPGVDPITWRDAVSRTHALLVTVTASNLLDVKQMGELRAELDAVVARAREQPDTARAELTALWDALAERAEFLFKDSRSRDGDRHPRPKVLPSYGAAQVVPALDLIAEIVPPNIDPDAWRNAVGRTRALLLMVTDSNLLGVSQMKLLRGQLDEIVARTRAHPEIGLAELARVWDALADRAGSLLKDNRFPGSDRHPRPKILPLRHESLIIERQGLAPDNRGAFGTEPLIHDE